MGTRWQAVKSRLGRKVRVTVIALGAMIIGLVLLGLLLWSATRGRTTHLRVTQPGELRTLIPSIVGLTQGALEQGNKIAILQNGDGFFPVLLKEIENAKETINFESYVWWKGEICKQIAQALAKKAREGVEVRVLLDASGSSRMDDDLEKMMIDAGCQVRKFHPLRISNLGRMNNRDHRKIMVFDGRIGMTGGHGIAEEWTGDGQDRKHWRDTFLRVEGPIVNQLQSAFFENWIEETGEVVSGEKYFPRLPPAGPSSAHLAYTSPSGTVSSVELLHAMAIAAARKEILISNPYFLPNKDVIELLAKAVQRGVDVRVMVPSAEVNDFPMVQHASHRHYGTLIKRGIKIYEYEKTLCHQKVIIIDGLWSSVGSTNFDDRSFRLNDEVSMGIIDESVAAELKKAFEQDLRSAKSPTFDQWKDRGLFHKLKDGLAFVGNSQL
ncbi:MAG TPA: cardiolipin synthase [Thermoanaerobaculia bacterium]|nr:cardiolipin synthase [Thermoanaerobaculia bacterium]